MTDKLQIFDAFLTPEELQTCADAVKRPAWSFGQISQTSPVSTPFWMMTLTDGGGDGVRKSAGRLALSQRPDRLKSESS